MFFKKLLYSRLKSLKPFFLKDFFFSNQISVLLVSDGFGYPKPERENCADASVQPHSAGAIVLYC